MMNEYPEPRPVSLWSRLIVLPAVIGLVSASILAGFASGALTHKTHASRTTETRPVQTANKTGADATKASAADNTPQTADPVEDYKNALSLLKDNYYGQPIDSKKTQTLTYEAIRGMLGSLHDPFTSFLDPDEWRQMQETTRGDFKGIGAMLQMDGAAVKIVEPIENSPAEKVGIKPDDVIVRVDGKPILGKDLNDVVKMIRGEEGTQVRLGILRGKKEMEIAITRGNVEPPVVKYWMEDNAAKIGHIALMEFNEKSMERLTSAFEDLEGKGMKALVFDLRGNPGGLLDVAVHVVSVFVPKDENPKLGNVAVFIHEGNGQEKRLMIHGEDYLMNHLPFVVLANENSASASEITSGAIKDYGVGTLIGIRTFGKGRVQTLFPLDDHSALRLTTALYFPPKHYDLNYKHDDEGVRVPNTGGILPDIEVKQPETWKGIKDKTNDVQLQKALTFLRARLSGKTVAQAKQATQTANAKK